MHPQTMFQTLQLRCHNHHRLKNNTISQDVTKSARLVNLSIQPDGVTHAKRTSRHVVIIALNVVVVFFVVTIIAFVCFSLSLFLALFFSVSLCDSGYCCPGVGGCVSYRNHKAFVQMVVLGLVEILLTFCVFVRGIWVGVSSDSIPALKVAGELFLAVFYFCAFFALCLLTHLHNHRFFCVVL